MGLIKAALGAAGGVLADQWKEYFYCEALPATTLMVKGQKRNSARSSNTKGTENIISNGSIIAIADGQCMMIVEQGKIVDICAEPGEYTYDMSTEPSIFAGNLGDSIKQTFQTLGKRFTFGGEAPKDQRIYYFNTKEIAGNLFGTKAPVPFRVVVNAETQAESENKCTEYTENNKEKIFCVDLNGLFVLHFSPDNQCNQTEDQSDSAENDSLTKCIPLRQKHHTHTECKQNAAHCS